MIEAYLIHLVILVSIYIILSISLQVSFGFSGLLNLGHVAFFGIGAYTSALLLLSGFSFIIAFSAALFMAGLFGGLLSILTRKLAGDYLALTTLGFSFVTYAVLINWKSVTNGPLGLPGIPRPEIFGFMFSNNLAFMFLVVSSALVSYFILHKITSSPFGRLMGATRDNELASQSLGKNTKKLKTISFVISACFAGVAGSLFASYITFIDPSSFTFVALIPLLLIVIIGGLASLPGTVLATIIIILIPELLRFVGLPSSVLGPIRQMLFATILLAILYYMPRGFYGKVDLE